MFKFKINMYAVYDNLNLIASFNLGDKEVVQEFFINIAYHLENKKWGSVYPIIMNEFYKGKLEQNHIDYAISEIKDIKKKLAEIDFSKIVCDLKTEMPTDLPDKKVSMSLDDIFINDKREKMTDKILTVLESTRKKKVPLYIGNYYQRELYKPELVKIIEKTKKRRILDNIIKYIVYLLIVIIVKLTVSQQQFNEFIIKFIFFMIVAELMILKSKLKLKSIQKEKEKQKELSAGGPAMIVEQITLERDLRSSRFDSILDEINCPKDYNKIIKMLKAKQVKRWQLDIKEIYSQFGIEKEYAIELIEKLEQYDNFEYYKIENISEAISKEKIENIYDENDIYRLIKYENDLNLVIFSNTQNSK